MKVLFLMNTGFQTTSRHLLISILKSLIKKGHDVTVVKRANKKDELDIAELESLNISIISVNENPPKKTNLIFRYISELRYFLKCKKYITSEFDAVFLQSTNLVFHAVKVIKSKNKKARIIFNVQDIFPYNLAYANKLKENGCVFKILANSQRKGYKKVDKIITISEDMKDTLVLDGIDSNKIEVIYNWSYKDCVYSAKELDFTSVSNIFNEELFNVVYAGNLGVMQNVDIVIETANLLKNDKRICFYIIGNGVYKEKLIQLVKYYGLSNLKFYDFVDSSIVPALYSMANLNVIPLVENIYKTALPSKTATCIACQKPIAFCIGKNSKFATKMKEEAGCFVLNSDDAQGLKNVIISLIENIQECDYTKVFEKYFQQTKNSNKYADVIDGIK